MALLRIVVSQLRSCRLHQLYLLSWIYQLALAFSLVLLNGKACSLDKVMVSEREPLQSLHFSRIFVLDLKTFAQGYLGNALPNLPFI